MLSLHLYQKRDEYVKPFLTDWHLCIVLKLKSSLSDFILSLKCTPFSQYSIYYLKFYHELHIGTLHSALVPCVCQVILKCTLKYVWFYVSFTILTTYSYEHALWLQGFYSIWINISSNNSNNRWFIYLSKTVFSKHKLKRLRLFTFKIECIVYRVLCIVLVLYNPRLLQYLTAS